MYEQYIACVDDSDSLHDDQPQEELLMNRLRGMVLLLTLMTLSSSLSIAQESKDTKDKKTTPPPVTTPTTPPTTPPTATPTETPAEGVKYKGFLPQNWKQLGLTDQQKQDIYRKQTQYKAKMKTLQEQMDKTKSEERKDLESVLTDEQKNDFVRFCSISRLRLNNADSAPLDATSTDPS